MPKNECVYSIWLAEAMGQGSTLAVSLLDLVGSAKALYEMSLEELLALPCVTSEKEREKIQHAFKNRDLTEARRVEDTCRRQRISILTHLDLLYPQSLKGLSDRPIVLYVRGTIPDYRQRPFVAIVGTRRMSDYGRTIAYALGYGIGLGGGIVVSGMALGTDSMAMTGALDAGAAVVAFLGGGADVIYPREHRDLYYRTIEHGAVISEYPPGTEPAGSHFPVRNRLISGISEATVVVEGNATSGALITAERAMEQGKRLFAVPGKVGDPGAEGPNDLLLHGALAAVSAEDVLIELEFLYPQTVRVQEAHAKMRHLNFSEMSRLAMERTRIGTRGEARYYGTGSYGGRVRDYAATGTARPNGGQEVPPAQKGQDGGKPSRKEQPSQPWRTAPAQSEKGTSAQRTKTGQTEADKPTHKETVKQKNSLLGSLLGIKTRKETEKTEKTESASEENQTKTTGFALNMLDETDLQVYNNMRPNVPVQIDQLVTDALDVSALLSSLSALEMAGLVESSAGGYYVRTGENMPITLDTVAEEAEDGTGAKNRTNEE